MTYRNPAIAGLAALTMLTAGLSVPASAASPDSVLGTWRTPTKHGQVEIVKCGASICGRLMESDGLKANPDLRDVNNKDQTKRGRAIKGLQILGGGFTSKGNVWSGGTIYNPEDGGTYKATITPDGADTLKLKGCIVWPLCKTQTWTRIR
nr:DUF2147 domain-containing protein [Novosphingobium sp. 9]